MQKYHIVLSETERQEIARYMRRDKVSEQSKQRLRILLDLDESSGKRLYTTQAIAKRRKTTDATIGKVCQRYVQGGWQAVAKRKERSKPARERKITGDVEAHIIATACSQPPEGTARWTLQMIADKIVVDGVVESISDEAVRKVLKKQH